MGLMIAVEVDAGLLTGVLVVMLGGFMTWAAYMSKTLVTHAEFQAKTAESLNHLDARVEHAVNKAEAVEDRLALLEYRNK